MKPYKGEVNSRERCDVVVFFQREVDVSNMQSQNSISLPAVFYPLKL